MAVVATVQYVDAAGQIIFAGGLLQFSGNYPTGGDPVNLAAAVQDAAFIGLLPALEASQVLAFDFWSAGGSLTRDYVANRVSAAPNGGFKAKMNTTKGSTSELAAGAYPGDVTADTIEWQAVLTKLL